MVYRDEPLFSDVETLLARYAAGERRFHDIEITGAPPTLIVSKVPHLNGADLSGAVLPEIDLGGAFLRRANLEGADLRKCSLSEAYLRGVQLRDADLTDAKLARAELNGGDLSGACLSGADLSEAELGGASLRGTRLTGADLGHADLSGADLSGADLHEVLFNGGTIWPIHFDVRAHRMVGPGARLPAHIREWELCGHDLRGADFSTCTFHDVGLANADLRGATLTRARFSDCNLTGARLDGADVRHAMFVDGTPYQSGWDDAAVAALASRGAHFDWSVWDPLRLLATRPERVTLFATGSAQSAAKRVRRLLQALETDAEVSLAGSHELDENMALLSLSISPPERVVAVAAYLAEHLGPSGISSLLLNQLSPDVITALERWAHESNAKQDSAVMQTTGQSWVRRVGSQALSIGAAEVGGVVIQALIASAPLAG